MRLRGFTLIELLITAAIMAIVSAAIISALAGGVNVYNRVRNLSGMRLDMLFALDNMEKTLRNTCNVSELEFVGEPKKITFPSPSPGTISYYINNSTHYLVSEERDYSAATAMEPPSGTLTQLVYASDIDFSYYYYDPASESYGWKDNWTAPAGASEKAEEEEGTAASKLGTREEKSGKNKLRVNTPLGLKIRVRYEERGETSVLERTLFFPLAVSLHFAEIAAEKAEKEEKKAVKDENKG